MASLIRNVDAAQPAVQAIVLPLSFISGIFIPASERPRWLADIGKVFPVQHLTAALLAAYNPHTTGPGCAGPTWLSSPPGSSRAPLRLAPLQLAATRQLRTPPTRSNA